MADLGIQRRGDGGSTHRPVPNLAPPGDPVLSRAEGGDHPSSLGGGHGGPDASPRGLPRPQNHGQGFRPLAVDPRPALAGVPPLPDFDQNLLPTSGRRQTRPMHLPALDPFRPPPAFQAHQTKLAVPKEMRGVEAVVGPAQGAPRRGCGSQDRFHRDPRAGRRDGRGDGEVVKVSNQATAVRII